MLLRLAISLILISATTVLPAGQKDAKPAKASTSDAAKLAEDQVRTVYAAVLAGKPVSETIAIQMLVDANRSAPDPTFQAAQVLFGMTVWNVAVMRAHSERAELVATDKATLKQSQRQIDEALVASWARIDAVLAQGRIPPAIVAGGKVYLAQYFRNTAQPDECRRYLEAYDVALGDSRVAPSLHGLYWTQRGLLADDERNMALALDCHSRAFNFRNLADMKPDIAQSRGNLGLIYLRLGDYAAAKSELDAAMGVYRQFPASAPALDVFHGLLNLSKALESQRDYDASIKLLDEARRYLPNITNETERRAADILLRNNLALVHYLNGQLVRAKQEFLACRETLASMPGRQFEHLAEVDANLGWVALTTGRAEEARQRFDQAKVSLEKHSPDYHRVPEIGAYLARAELACGMREQARTRLRAALAQRQLELDQVLQTALSHRDRLAYLQQLRLHPESVAWPGVFDTSLELGGELGITPQEQYAQLLAWKGALARHRGGDPAESDREKIRREIIALRAARPTMEESDATVRIAQLERQANALERSLRQRPQATQTQSPVVPSAVAAAIPKGAVLVDVLETRRYRPRKEGEPVADDRVYVAFVVRPDEAIMRVNLGASEEVDPAVELLNQRIAERRPAEDQRVALGNLIGAPIREAAGPTDLLIIAGDGWLNRIPWCVLPGIAKKYWAEELAIATVPSAQSLVARHARPPAVGDPTWLLVGGVDYGESRNGAGKPRFVPLPRTLTEIQQLHQLLSARFKPTNRPLLLTGSQAKRESIATVLRQRPGPRLVHLATHGEFPQHQAEAADAFAVLDATKALDSLLAFAGANDAATGANALMTAEELGSLDLASIDLMVLAACKSGLGHIAAGQGQVGLLGALDKAQVGTVIASLWQVDDDATGQLMDRFYARHFAAQNPASAADALRRAQLDLLSNPKSSDPYFWAAWMLMGKP